MSEKTQRVLEIDDWFLWVWHEPENVKTKKGYEMFHKCSDAPAHVVLQRYGGGYTCRVCNHTAPEGLVAAYLFMEWEAKGYG